MTQKVIHGDVTSVLLLNTDKLYKTATEEKNLPFHEYPSFIEDHVQKLVRRNLYMKWIEK